ncbi:MAG: ADP-glyceromanno-heptose 6-epimerase [Gammaproteobacteria bacterium]|nr:ADP-glyceromanno-heptose 6-epimerase [Gammaproteobacteria bacterium]
MIIVTGGAGFIGSNLVRGLNTAGRNDLLIVDNLTNGAKFRNLVDCDFLDYMDKQDFLQHMLDHDLPYKDIDLVFHQGACSRTTEWDGRYMMQNNYEYSKRVLEFCEDRAIPFIYASSAAVYGTGTDFSERTENEQPVNMYAYSKFLFDQYIRKTREDSAIRIIGLRYFNVYGPGEAHKQDMASVAYHLDRQLQNSECVRLFKGCDGYGDGEQRRDFIHVDDIVAVNLWCMQDSAPSGIYNVGTGVSRSFNDVANEIIRFHGHGRIEYIDFPEHLSGSYQSFTEADLTSLRNAGYSGDFKSLEEGITGYLKRLAGAQAR